MKNRLIIILIFGLSMAISCKQKAIAQASDVEAWKLGWRMIANSMEENYEIADLQFDSLQSLAGKMDRKFLVVGLEVKSKLDKNDAIIEILITQDEERLREICPEQFLANLEPCIGLSDEKVENKALQMELIRMYVDDQAARGNIMEDIISKFNLDTSLITKNGAVGIDERNRNRLKEIFEEYGFPTRKLVGKDAMFGIFLMIQHADGDKEWQKSQLKNIEEAVKAGDLDGQSYAYLYDRIKINNGEKQVYGTQFAKVDRINKTVELAETEDLENLDKRRREIGMMPIEMYKRFLFKYL
ncbi:MAG: hypothetical protein H6557_08605 [Lewinellaceae bacterium]|nr:hypothetical protein [Phaeodactylibacter sp.]MCB9036664.1 hypothetical protein [Lewinellaceae bacterium]